MNVLIRILVTALICSPVIGRTTDSSESSLILSDLLKDLSAELMKLDVAYTEIKLVTAQVGDQMNVEPIHLDEICQKLRTSYNGGDNIFRRLNMMNDFYIQLGTDDDFNELASAEGFGELFSNSNIHAFIAVQNELISSLGFCADVPAVLNADFAWSFMTVKYAAVEELKRSLDFQLPLIEHLRRSINAIGKTKGGRIYLPDAACSTVENNKL